MAGNFIYTFLQKTQVPINRNALQPIKRQHRTAPGLDFHDLPTIKIWYLADFQLLFIGSILNFETWYIWTADERLNRRKILAVCTQLKQLRKKSLKKIQAWTGFEPITSAMPVQCSTNQTIKPTGSGSYYKFFIIIFFFVFVFVFFLFRFSFRNCLSCVLTARIFLLFNGSIFLGSTAILNNSHSENFEKNFSEVNIKIAIGLSSFLGGKFLRQVC